MSGETILVTRPLGDEAAITEMLHRQGFRVMHEPLTSIVLDHTQRLALSHALEREPDAIIVTSRHAVQALSMLTDLRDMLIICVGEATASVATSLGFMRIDIAGGTSDRLVSFITDAYDEGTRFLYLSGEHIRTDLITTLSRHRMHVQRLILYEAMAAEQLSDTLVEYLKRRQVDAVTFMSQRTAQIFMALLAKAGMQEAVTCLQAFALSTAIAESLVAQPWQRVHITREATLASLVDSVDNAYATKG